MNFYWHSARNDGELKSARKVEAHRGNFRTNRSWPKEVASTNSAKLAGMTIEVDVLCFMDHESDSFSTLTQQFRPDHTTYTIDVNGISHETSGSGLYEESDEHL